MKAPRIAHHLVLLGLLIGAQAIPSAEAAAYPCTEAGLESAIQTGGTASFNCDGDRTINLTKDVNPTRFISKNLDLVVNSGTLTISGVDTYRLFIVNSGVSAKLSRVNLVHGRVTDASTGFSRGGAIFMNSGSTLELSEVLLAYNEAHSPSPTQNVPGAFGGAIYNAGSNLSIYFSTVRDNVATSVSNATGGFLYADSSTAKTTIVGSYIFNNKATSTSNGIAEGGAISNYKGALNVTDSYLTTNYATAQGAGTARGAAVANSNQNGTISKVEYSYVAGNESKGLGNGTQTRGGAFYNDPTGNLSVKDTAIWSNIARANVTNGFGYGGAFFNANGGITAISGGVVQANLAEGTAGAGGSGFAAESSSGSISYRNLTAIAAGTSFCASGSSARYVSQGGNMFPNDVSCSTSSSDFTPLSFVSQIAGAAASTTISTKPTSSGQAGVTLSLQNNAGLPASVAALTLNPSQVISNDGSSLSRLAKGVTLIGQDGAGFTAVRIVSDNGAGLIGQDGAGLRPLSDTTIQVVSDQENRATLSFYYSSNVSGSAEGTMNLLYHTAAGWAPVYSSGNTLPVRDTTDNLDGTVSGGKLTVVLDSSSTPKLSEAGDLLIAVLSATVPPPSTTLLLPVVVNALPIG